MSKNNIQISISARLSETAEKNLQRELDEISKRLKLTVKNTQVANKSLASSSNTTTSTTDKTVQSLSKYEKGLNSLIHLYKMKEISDRKFLDTAEKMRSKTEFNTLAWKKQEQVVNLLTQAEKNYQKVRDTETNIHKKQEQEREKALQYEQRLQSAIRKNIEAEKKRNLEIERRIALFKKDMQTTIKGIKGKDGAYVNQTSLANLEKSVSNITPIDKDAIYKMQQAKSELKALNTETSIYKKRIQDANKHTNIFGQSLFEAGKKFAGWLFMGNIIMQTIGVVRSGIDVIIQMDKEMVNLRKVTDETNEAYKDFQSTVNDLAVSLGKSQAEVVQSSTEFARLGYGLRESAILAREALILSNVGDIDIDLGTKHLISIIKAFGITVDDQGKNIRHIVDLTNETANNFAISQEGIGEALRRSSASMYAAGNTLEETIALITATNEVIQDPAVVGTAFKTVSMRIRGVVDEFGDATNMIPKTEEVFQSIGLTLKENEDTFKSTIQILREVHGVWDDLSNMKQAEILEVLAGKRQGQVIAGLLQNFEQVEAALETMENSYGSAAIEYSKYMDGLEYKTQRLSAIVSSIWLDGISSDSFKDIIDAITVLVIGVQKLTDTFGLLPSVLGVVGTALVILNTNFRLFITNIQIAGVSINSLMAFLTGLVTKFGLTSISIRGATIALKAFAAAATFGASLALGFVLEKIISKTASYADTLSATTDKLLENINTEQILIDKVDELVAKLKSGNLAYEEQVEIQKEIAQILPDATTGYTEQNEALAENLELIRFLNEEKKREIENIAWKTLSDLGGDKKRKKLLEDNKKLDAEIIKSQQELNRLLTNYGNKHVDIDRLIESISKSNEKYQKNQKEIKKITEAMIILAPYINLTTEEVDELKESLGRLSGIEKQVSNVINSINLSGKTEDEINKIKQQLTKLFEDIDSDNFEWTKEIEDGLISIGVEGKNLEKVKEYFKKIKDAAEDAVPSTNKLTGSLKEMFGAIKSDTDQLKDYYSVLNDIREGKEISIDTIMNLIDKYDDFGKAVEVENGILKINEKTLYELITAKKSDMIATAESEYKKTVDVAEGTRSRLANYGIELETIKTLAEARRAAAMLASKEVGGDGRQGAMVADYYYKMFAPIANAAENLEKLKAGINSIGKSFGSSSSSSGSSSTSKEFSKIYDLATTKAEKFKHEIELLNDALDDTEDIIKKQDISNQLIAKYQEYYNYLKEVFTYQNSQLDQVKTKLKSVLSDSDFNKLMNGDFSSLTIANEDTAELIDKFKDLQSAVRSTDIELNSIDDSIRTINKQWEDNVREIANNIINIYKSTYEKQKDLKLRSIDDEIKAEDRRHKQVMDNYNDELSKIEEIINAKLKSIDKEESKESYEKQLSKLQKERQDIVNQRDILSMDDSLEARNKVFKLNEELSKKEEEIKELQSKRESDLRKENLKDQLNSYKKDVERKKQAEDKKYNAAKQALEDEKKEWERHYENLINDERKFARIREDIMKGHLDNVMDDLDGFSDFFDDNMKDIGESISQNVIDNIKKMQNALNSINYGGISNPANTGNDSNGNSNSNIQGKTFKGTTHTYYVDKDGNVFKDDRWLELNSAQVKALTNDPQGYQALEYSRWVKANRKHDGGFVSADSPPNKISDLVNKLFNTKGDERLTLALKDEFFSPQKNIMSNFIPNMRNFVSSIAQPNTSSGLHFDSLLTINGNVDRAVMPQLEDLVNRAAYKVAEIQKKNLNMSGVFRRV